MGATQRAEERVSWNDLVKSYEVLMERLDEERERLAEAGEDFGADAEVAFLTRCLDGVEGQAADKGAGMIALIRRREGFIETRKAWKRGFDELQRRDDNAVKRIREVLAFFLGRLGMDKLQTALGTISLARPKLKLTRCEPERAFEPDGKGRALAHREVRLECQSPDHARDVMGWLEQQGLVCSVVVVMEPQAAHEYLESCPFRHAESEEIGYSADIESLLAIAQRDAERLADWETVANEGHYEPPKPELPEWAEVEAVRTLSIR